MEDYLHRVLCLLPVHTLERIIMAAEVTLYGRTAPNDIYIANLCNIFCLLPPNVVLIFRNISHRVICYDGEDSEQEEEEENHPINSSGIRGRGRPRGRGGRGRGRPRGRGGQEQEDRGQERPRGRGGRGRGRPRGRGSRILRGRGESRD